MIPTKFWPPRIPIVLPQRSTMTPPRSPALLLPLLFLSFAAPGCRTTTSEPSATLAWPAPTQTTRPWTRWWWLGSGVDAPNLQRLLTAYRDAGLGGGEICPDRKSGVEGKSGELGGRP